MPGYMFFISGADIKTVVSGSAYAAQLLASPGTEKIDFETEASDKQEAQLKLKTHLEKNNKSLKNFTGDITFSAIIESLLR